MKTICMTGSIFVPSSLSPEVRGMIDRMDRDREDRRAKSGRYEPLCTLFGDGHATYSVVRICPEDVDWIDYDEICTIERSCPDPEGTASEIAFLLNLKEGK